jgi:hypothetical protein
MHAQAAEAQGAPSELPFADKDFMRMLSDILGEDEDAERDAALPADVQRALTRQGISAAELYCAQAAGLAAGGAPAPAARAPLAVSGGVRRKGRPRSPQVSALRKGCVKMSFDDPHMWRMPGSEFDGAG